MGLLCGLVVAACRMAQIFFTETLCEFCIRWRGWIKYE